MGLHQLNGSHHHVVAAARLHLGLDAAVAAGALGVARGHLRASSAAGCSASAAGQRCSSCSRRSNHAVPPAPSPAPEAATQQATSSAARLPKTGPGSRPLAPSAPAARRMTGCLPAPGWARSTQAGPACGRFILPTHSTPPHLLEERLDEVCVVHKAQRLAPRVQGAVLGQPNHLVHVLADRHGLGLRTGKRGEAEEGLGPMVRQRGGGGRRGGPRRDGRRSGGRASRRACRMPHLLPTP